MAEGMITVQELEGDPSTTDVELVFDDQSVIPGFDTHDQLPVKAVLSQPFPGYSQLFIGAGVGELSLPDLEFVGDLTPEGRLGIDKSVLGGLIVEGQPLPTLPYRVITPGGRTVVVIEIVEPEATV